MNALCQKLIGEGEGISDMRGFKNQIRNLQEAVADHIASGKSEDDLVNSFKEYKKEFEEQKTQAPPVPDVGADASGESGEKRQIILNTFGEEKYKNIRDFLILKATVDPNFSTFQQYLDNILSSRLVAKDMSSFSEGVKKIKEFRDNLEQELLSNAN